MGASTYDLGPPTLFLFHLANARIVIARIECAILNQNVTARIAATITTVAMGIFMTDRSEFGILHMNSNHHGS
jgi:hypothetical protein